MTNQLRRLRHRFSRDRRHDVQLLIQTCNRCGLDESQVGHLCEKVFTEHAAADALDTFLKYLAEGQEEADSFLLSRVPPRPTPRDYLAEERWSVFKVLVTYPFRRLLRLPD